MGTEQEERAAQEALADRLVLIADTMGRVLAGGGAIASPDLIAQALIEAHVPELISTPAISVPPSPRRYTAREIPGDHGPMVTISFRLPRAVKELFDERVAELKADPGSGITNQTDAGQDAITKWCLMEGK